MVVKDLIVVFTVAPSTLTLLPALSTLNVRQAWEQARWLWEKHVLNNCVGTWPAWRSRIFTVTMVFTTPVSFVTTAFQKTNPKLFLVLEQSIKMQLRNTIFKQHANGPAIWWFIQLFIGQAIVPTIYISGLLLFNMQCGCSIAFQIESPVWLHLEFSPRPSLIIKSFNMHTFGVALFLCWTIVSKMARRFQSGIIVLALHSLWGSCLNIPHWLPMFDTFKPIMSARSFIWFTTTTSNYTILCPTSASLIFLIRLVKFTQRLNAQKTALLLTRHLLLMTSSWMKVNAMRSALKLQSNVLRQETIGILKLSNLRCIYLLVSPLTFLVILLLVMTAISCLLPMRARLPLITTIPPLLLTLVVVVSTPGRMRELLLVVHTKAKDWGKEGMHFQHTLSLVWCLVYPNFWIEDPLHACSCLPVLV